MPEKSREKEEKSHAEKNERRPLVVGSGRIENGERESIVMRIRTRDSHEVWTDQEW